MGHELDSTLRSFPAYGDLTQTQAWAKKAAPVHADVDEAAHAVEVSHGSRYAEGEELGKGGMGRVLLARDARIGRDVAVKVLHPERELEPDERARFLREAQVQGQLEHPSIVPVYDIDRRADGTTFFTMRRVLGRTLAAIIDDLRKGTPAAKVRYTQRELLTAFATVCLTIDYAHSRGVVHRDLKPANIMLGDFGEVYVLDWGLARLVDERGQSKDEPEARLSMPGDLLGTPMYMAPEQMADPDVGPGADVFSLGLILFEILTFERARDPAALWAPIDARPSVRAPQHSIAPELEMICVRATEGDPKDRYPTPRAMQEAINRYLEGDRDMERRRELAASYTKEAAAALANADEPGADQEAERTNAIRKLRHALALDPSNTENIRLLGAIITTPPRVIPAEVVAQIRAQEEALVKTGARHSVAANGMWFLFLPIVLWMGVRAPWQVALVLAPAGLGALVSGIAGRFSRVPKWMQLTTIGLTIFGAAATTTMFGPLVLVPTLLATFTIVLQAHPSLFMRLATWTAACVALAIVSLIELFHPASYSAAGGAIVILPRMHELPRTASIILLLGTSLGMTIVPSLFIGRIRSALNDAQRQILVQAWQFKRFGEDLISTSRTTRP